MKNYYIKKIVTLGAAAMMSVSAMSVSAFAQSDTKTWKTTDVEVRNGTVDSLDELVSGSISYTTDENGRFVLQYDNGGISPFGSSTPPSTIAGGAKIYVYGTGTGSDEVIMNTDNYFKFSFNSSCTTSTTQYAEFFVGATSTSKKIYFKGTGDNNASVNIRLKSMTSGVSDTSSKVLSIRSSNYDYVYFNGLTNGAIYAIELTPVTAGKAVSGTINVSGNSF